MQRILKTGCLILILVSFDCLTGCYYYGVSTKTKLTPEDIRWEDFNDKYLILHFRDSAMHMVLKNVDSAVMTCSVSALPDNHTMYLTTNPNRDNRFRKKSLAHSQGDVLNEVHLYASAMKKTNNSIVLVDFSSITKMEIYRYSPGHSTLSHVLPSVLALPAAAGLVGLIILLTKSSCPYVYIYTNDNFVFAGEIFSGAVYPSLERNDYLPLPGFEPANGKYLVKIANKLPEIQHINLSELWVVQHPVNTGVLVDKHGVIHTFSAPRSPESAISAGNRDQLNLLTTVDDHSFIFDEDPSVTLDTCARNSLCLTFRVPPDSHSGKLILHAKNSVWGDYIFGEFSKQFGNKYGAWVRKQGKTAPDKPLMWKKDQVLPLMVYLETNDGWQFVDFFDLAGPLAFRDMVMPIDLSTAMKGHSGQGNQVRIKIETGFMFWELDYASMDFSQDLPVRMNAIKPSSAVNESGKKVEKLLAADDDQYYNQPETGNEVILDFTSPDITQDGNRSIFLHSKGYYVHVRNYQNPPDISALETFRIPGRLSQFSFDRFSETKSRFSAKYPSSPKK